eukprot:3208393-Amphidinium_carterae.1
MKILGDPDAEIISDGEFNYEVGVPVGREGFSFSRTPAVFREKCKWRIVATWTTSDRLLAYRMCWRT